MTDLKKAAEYAAQDTIKFADESEEMRAVQQFHEEVKPEAVLALIAENEALKGPHDWLAEDLIKELVDNAQSFQENSCEEGEDPFVIVLLAAASRIRRQEANLDQLKTENKRLVPFEEAYGTACNVRNRLIRENELLDQLIVHNKALSDSFRAECAQLKTENKVLKAKTETWCSYGDEGSEHTYYGDKSAIEALTAQIFEVEALRSALKAAEDAMWHADGNMDGEAADARDALAAASKGERS